MAARVISAPMDERTKKATRNGWLMGKVARAAEVPFPSACMYCVCSYQ